MDPSRAFTRQDVVTGPPQPVDGEEAGGAGPRTLPMLPDPVPVGAPPSYHVLTKPTGAICNLDCTYCFFLSKEALYPGSKFRMTDESHEQYIRQLLESHQTPHVVIAWQGGEPTLMGLDFYRETMKLVEKYRRPGQIIEHTLQTNGTKLDEEWAAFLAEHGFLTGLSMDGPADIHDAQRVDKGGKGTHDKVMRAARLLQDAGAEFNILCTVHQLNGDRGKEVYRFFRDEVGATFMQFIPIIERATPELLAVAEAGWGDSNKARPLYEQKGDLVTSRSIGQEQYGRFLVDIFEEWVRRDVGRIYVQMFDVTLSNFVGGPPGLCIHAETCGRGPALEHNGDLYTCDHFVEPKHKLGNINETHMLELVSSPQMEKFGKDKRDTLPRGCRECDVRFACHGGCPKDRFRNDPYGEPGLNYLCAGFKTFFGHVTKPMRQMEEYLRAGRPAAEIMYAYSAQDAARGRNDDCTCGSGRKFKRCHGDQPLPSKHAIDEAVRAVMS
jgi:uncharacterized protein